MERCHLWVQPCGCWPVGGIGREVNTATLVERWAFGAEVGSQVGGDCSRNCLEPVLLGQQAKWWQWPRLQQEEPERWECNGGPNWIDAVCWTLGWLVEDELTAQRASAMAWPERLVAQESEDLLHSPLPFDIHIQLMDEDG